MVSHMVPDVQWHNGYCGHQVWSLWFHECHLYSTYIMLKWLVTSTTDRHFIHDPECAKVTININRNFAMKLLHNE